MSPETESVTIGAEDVGTLVVEIVDTPTPPPADALEERTHVAKANRTMEWLTKRTNRMLYRMDRQLEVMKRAQDIYDDCATELTLVKQELDEAFVAAQAALNAPVPKREPREGDVVINVPTGELRASSPEG